MRPFKSCDFDENVDFGEKPPKPYLQVKWGGKETLFESGDFDENGSMRSSRLRFL